MINPLISPLASLLLFLLATSFAAWAEDTATAAEPELARFQYSEPHMGAGFRIVLYADNRQTADAAAKAAFLRIAELDASLSDYKADSELNQLCRASPTQKFVPVSGDLFTVLRSARRLSQQSEGAFDVTVGPYSRLWRRARRARRLPPADDLSTAGEAVGYKYVQLRDCDPGVKLLKADMQLDLGGIAKGYAADAALAVLAQNGVTRALVDGSGDMALGDSPPGKEGWRIGIAPLAAAGPPSRVLTLSNCGIATSGDAWQYLEIDGVRYSHIVDPRTGLGLTTPISVTVIAANGMTADALASAVSVLGPDKGFLLVDRKCHAAALVVRSSGDDRTAVETLKSKNFDTLAGQAQSS